MYEYKLIRSRRKSISLQIDDNCELVVRAPLRMSQKEIDRMVAGHTAWIEKHMPAARQRMENDRQLTPALLAELTEQAKAAIPPRVEYYAKLMGVEPTGVKITTARKRFGSCSGRNSLCFSCLLMLYPPEAVDCVVVHELAHIRHHDHSAAFYAFINQFMPDYRQRELLLKQFPKITGTEMPHFTDLS